jgi:hypothetical protein
MAGFQSIEELEKYSAQLNADVLREAEPSGLYDIVRHLRDKEVDLLRRAYYTEISKSRVDWKTEENRLALQRLENMHLLRKHIDDNGKGYKFTRLGKKITKLLVEDFFPFDVYPAQTRVVTPAKIYRDHYIKTYYNRKPVTSNSVPTEKVGSYDFATKLIEFDDVPAESCEGRIKNIQFKDTKATKILKEKTEKALQMFRSSGATRVLRPLLYNRRTDEVIFLVAMQNQSVYVRGNNTEIAYLRHRYGDDIKFLVNANHLNKVLFLAASNPALPVMVLDRENNPVAVIGDGHHLIKERRRIREIINSFQRTHEIEEETEED